MLLERDPEVLFPDPAVAPLVLPGKSPVWLALAESLHGDSRRFHLAMAVDAAAIALAMGPAQLSVPAAAALTLAFVVAAVVSGLYRRRSTIEAQGVGWAAWRLAVAGGFISGLLWGLNLHGITSSSRVRWIAVAVATLVALRTVAWLAVSAARRRGHGLRPTLLSGPAAAVDRVARRLPAFPETGLRVVATQSPAGAGEQRRAERAFVGIHKRALDLIDRREVEHVLLIAAGGDDSAYEELVHRGAGSGIVYSLVVPLTGLSRQPLQHRIGDLGVLPLGQVDFSGGPMLGKRAFDVAGALILLALLAPLLLMTAAAVWLSDRGPVFYRQQRVGRRGQPFLMWKFRSMVVGADRMVVDHLNVGDGLLFKVERDPRVTWIGTLLRRFALDELPQLFNVVSGDMSLVGPRPLPVEPEDFDEVAAQRHGVRPGITGPWQVHGGNALSYGDMVDLDLAYISTWSFRGDMLLLLRTLPALLVRRAPF